MSVLIGKQVLVIGDEDERVAELRKTFEAHGIRVQCLPCSDISEEKIEELKPDLIFINHVKSTEVCKGVLNFLQTNIFNKVMPTFVLVEDSNDRIQEVMSYGATDYVIPQESSDTVMQKVKALLTDRGNFEGTSAIDITPEKFSSSSKGVKVFVVEDDPLLRNLLSISFEKSGFPSEFSRDGQQITALLTQFKPDVVILDLMLPGKSGFEVLEEIKADDTLKDIPVIIFSNRDGQEDRKKAMQLGARAFYVKAMTDLSELLQKIEKLVKNPEK